MQKRSYIKGLLIKAVGGFNVQRKGFWLLLLLTVLTIFVNLGSMPLLDPDEPVYAETPKEMILYHDFISPQIYGQYWYDKPPVYYWLVVGAFKLFGVNEFAARFPSAILAVVGVLLVYVSVTELISKRAGLMSGLVLATSIEYFYLGKAAVTDITLTLFLTASLLFFLQKKYYLFYIFSALATLTKGPIGFLFPGAIIVIWMAITRRFGELKDMKIPMGIILFGIIALPWYGVMYQIHGTDFLNGFIGVNNITRFTTAEHAKTSGWYFFIPVLILGFFPWTALMVQSIRSSLKSKGTEMYHILLFLNIWAAFIFVFFSISSTKLITYILPVYPPLAILVGWYIDQLWQESRLKGKEFAWPILSTLFSILFVVGMALGVKMMPVITLGAVALSTLFVLMTLLLWYFLRKQDVLKAVWSQAVAMTIASVILITVIVPPISDGLSTRSIAQSFLANYDGSSPVYVIKFLHPGFTFYTNVYGKEINSDSEIRRVISAKERAFLIIRQPEYLGLSNSDQSNVTVLAQTDNKILLLTQ